MTIKEIREKYNLTQSALARSLGVSSNAISGIEGGRIRALPLEKNILPCYYLKKNKAEK